MTTRDRLHLGKCVPSGHLPSSYTYNIVLSACQDLQAPRSRKPRTLQCPSILRPCFTVGLDGVIEEWTLLMYVSCNMTHCIQELMNIGTKNVKKVTKNSGLDVNVASGVDILKSSFSDDGIPAWAPGRGYVNVVRPRKGVSDTCCLFVHGGGFTSGSPDGSYRPFSSKMVKRMGMTMYVPDYTLTPEASYPTQVNEILSLAKWLRKYGHRDIVLFGDSAGATIALSAALIAPKLFSRCIFLSPWIDLRSPATSYSPRTMCAKGRITGAGDPVFRGSAQHNETEFRAIAIEYLGKASRLNRAPSNPALATKSMLSQLPPSLFMVGDRELLREEVLTFVARAQKVNQHIVGQLYDGMWHDWPMYSEGCGGPPVRKAILAQKAIAEFAKGGTVTDSSGTLEASITVVVTPQSATQQSPSKSSRRQRSRRSKSASRLRSKGGRRTRRKS